MKNRRDNDSDVNVVLYEDRNSYFNGNSTGMPRSSSQSCIPTHQQQSALLNNDPQRALAEMKLDSYGYIRSNTCINFIKFLFVFSVKTF